MVQTESHTTEEIVFGGGCFWCIEAVFQMIRGVVSITSGYAGGAVAAPNYREVSSDDTGHAEVVKVIFDPYIVSLNELLAVFFYSHDPTTRNRQGADVGTQYRSVIFYTTLGQRTAIEKFIENLGSENIFSKPIVTDVEPLEAFYVAEPYHQNYYQTNQEQSYCQVVIDPKVKALRKKFAHLLL